MAQNVSARNRTYCDVPGFPALFRKEAAEIIRDEGYARRNAGCATSNTGVSPAKAASGRGGEGGCGVPPVDPARAMR